MEKARANAIIAEERFIATIEAVMGNNLSVSESRSDRSLAAGAASATEAYDSSAEILIHWVRTRVSEDIDSFRL